MTAGPRLPAGSVLVRLPAVDGDDRRSSHVVKRHQV